MQQESAIDKLGRDRKLEMLFTAMPFKALAQEIIAHEDRFKEIADLDHPFFNYLLPCRTLTPETGPLQAEDTPTYADLSEVHKVVMWLAAVVQAEQIGEVTVTRLDGHEGHPAGADEGPYADHYDRFYIVATGKGMHVSCADETAKMMPGEVWWLYNNDPIEVWNRSETPSDCLVVDLKLRGDKRTWRTGEGPPDAEAEEALTG